MAQEPPTLALDAEAGSLKLRVLHVLPSLDEAHGGPLRLVLDLSARSMERGLESEIVGPGPIRVRDNPLPSGVIHPLAGGAWKGWAHCPAIRLWLREHLRRFDGVVIHGAWLYPGWAAAAECTRAGIPYAYYPHGMIERWAVTGQGKAKEIKKRLYWSIWESRIASGAVCTFFTTKREMDLSNETFPLASPNRLLAPYGIDRTIKRVAHPSNPALEQHSGTRVALYLGRLHPKKNPDLLIEAWRRAGPPRGWRLVMAGSGPAGYAERLKAQAHAAGVQDSIHFTGFVSGEDKLYLLQKADWFLLPSSQENFGIAVLEAIQNGSAVALSDGVYLTESFPPGSEILPVDVAAWTIFLRDRMTDDTRRRKIRDDNYAHLSRHFGMDTVLAQWVRTFEAVFARRKTKAA